MEAFLPVLILLGQLVLVSLTWRIWWYGRAAYPLVAQVGISALTGFAISAIGLATVVALRSI